MMDIMMTMTAVMTNPEGHEQHDDKVTLSLMTVVHWYNVADFTEL